MAVKKGKSKKHRKKIRNESAAKILSAISRIFGILFALSIVLISISLSVLALTIPNWDYLKEVDFNLILEFVRIFAWPGVTILVLFSLKNEIALLLGRVKSAHMGDKSVEFAQSQAPSQAEAIELESKQQKQETPEEFKERVYQVPDVKLAFERIYRNIFGTQISALTFLAGSPSGVHTKFLEPYFYKYRQLDNSPTAFPGIHEYMAYLKSNGLVSYDGSKDLYRLNDPAGTLFMRYLAEEGLSDPNSKGL